MADTPPTRPTPTPHTGPTPPPRPVLTPADIDARVASMKALLEKAGKLTPAQIDAKLIQYRETLNQTFGPHDVTPTPIHKPFDPVARNQVITDYFRKQYNLQPGDTMPPDGQKFLDNILGILASHDAK